MKINIKLSYTLTFVLGLITIVLSSLDLFGIEVNEYISNFIFGCMFLSLGLGELNNRDSIHLKEHTKINKSVSVMCIIVGCIIILINLVKVIV